ncbi:MAG: LamG domain-containing protein [Candidatus Poribacteria bacterium]|jgi:hypothetical protein|nr:LamG domain-containing protein [Candidatus Poribacteria bacterium]MDP6747936.1 LamG domain-containing protein [Candidatus Poribacteria bacterium]MDP6998228.1 LamG domain-containing protein [Candidatus Poribacteria bacterium]
MQKTATILFLMLFTASVLLTGLTPAQEFVTDGLVAFYSFDKDTVKGDTLNDVFGKKDAKIFEKPKLVPGKFGEAFEYKAKGYVEIPKLGDWKQVSIECWANEKQFSGIQGIVSTWMWAAGKVHFKFEGGEIQVHKNDGVKIRMKCKEEQWYHIIYTSDPKDGGAKSLKLYVDGELIQEGQAGKTPENMNERRIASEHNGRFLNGMIDEVRIYDRILTEKEVTQNFKIKSNKLAVDPADKVATTWGYLKSKI